MAIWKHYVETHNATNEIMAYHYARPTVPEAQSPDWTVYEVKTFPDEYSYYCEGMAFDKETGALKHTQKSTNIVYRKYLRDTDWYLIRNFETGAEVPAGVLEKRAYARAAIIN
jgi:hypothetical protein